MNLERIAKLRRTYLLIHNSVLSIGSDESAFARRELGELQRYEEEIVRELRDLGANPYAPCESPRVMQAARAM